MAFTSSGVIKICGVTCSEDALFALDSGAHEIGMILHPPSPRHVSLERAKVISQVTKEAGGVPVAVFAGAPVDLICRACHACGIEHVQLHGGFTSEDIQALLTEFKVRGALRVTAQGEIVDEDRKQWEPFADQVHCFVYDSTAAGSGQTFNWREFSPISSRPWMLAGGLDSENVGGAIITLSPHGVDVSSGVEGKSRGVKDHTRLVRFIEEVTAQCQDC